MKEIIFTCSEGGYELYEMLGKYFDNVEMITIDNNEMLTLHTSYTKVLF